MKQILFILSIVLFFSCTGNQENKAQNIENTDENIVFAVPFAPVSYPILKMIDDGNFYKGKKKMELIVWNTPDQLKALIVGKQADIFAVPSNVAATFYNKNTEVKLLNICIWRGIWMVSRSNDKKTLSDFKGEEIIMPFRGDMPHIVFMTLARKQGLDPEKDFKLNYVPTPMDAAKMMIMRRGENALLVDPAVSTVLQKSKSGLTSVIAPDMYRSVDMQNEWGRLFDTPNEIPFAGIMAGKTALNDSTLLQQFAIAHKEATEWCMQHPEETAKIAVKYIPQLNEKAVAEAMRNVTLRSDDAKDIKDRLSAFYQILLNEKPALIGGKLPDDDFYFGK